MDGSEKPLLAPLADSRQVRAVLDAVGALTPDQVLRLTPDLAEISSDVSVGGLDTSPDTIFVTPDGTRFEAAATAYLALVYGRSGGKKQSMTESFPAIIKGRLAEASAHIDEIVVDTVDLYEPD